jgi:class 3 adenylate cyclase
MSRLPLRFEQVLTRELHQAEGVKAAALAILFTLGMLNGFILSLRVPAALLRPGYSIKHLAALSTIAAFGALTELAMWLAVRRRTRREQPVPAAWGWALTGLECLLPTASLTGIALILNEPKAFSAPAGMMYGILLTTTALRLDPRRCLFAAVLSAGSHFGMAALLLRLGYLTSTVSSGLWVHSTRAFLILLAGGAAALVAQQLRRRIEHSVAVMEDRSRVVATFGRYLNDEVVDVLLNSPHGQRLGGHKCEVSLLMTDLRGFSSLSERLPPERVMLLLNHYLGAMTEIIARHRGTIDEFIGDAILVIFGAPLPQEDHAVRALRCALEMQQAMAAVNAWNHAQELPEIEMGVGVHSGAVVVGNIGSAQRQKYGVVGSAVNLTARIESFTVGGQILVSADTAARIGAGLHIRQTREVQPKGSRQPMCIFDVAGYEALRLPPIELSLVEIAPLSVRLRLVEGKALSEDFFSGEILALSARGARLRCATLLSPWQNLAVEIDGGIAFAKVVQVDGVITLRFTDWDEQARAALDRRLPANHGAKVAGP